MPPRKKPASSKQKKAEMQLKRAVKRGDLPPPEKKQTPRKKSHKIRIGPTGHVLGSAANPSTADAIDSSRKLQSAFITLPPKFLEQTRHLASNLALPRPLPDTVAVYHGVESNSEDATVALSCPRRPKWRFDMTKKEVEKNEEGIFKKWLTETDRLVEDWQKEVDDQNEPDPDEPTKPLTKMPRAPTYFERNIEVWRQLWRVTEISQIILVLLDSRCPLLHFPPSLSTYLSVSNIRIILVLTKVDISGAARAEAWTNYFTTRYPDIRVVQVESYTQKESRTGNERQGRKQYEPHLPDTFRERLVSTIKDVHREMLIPPEAPPKVKDKDAWRKKWRPGVKTEVDWEAVSKAGGDKVGSIIGGATAPRPRPTDDDDDQGRAIDELKEPEFLTIGLIGQPNVGKSSLLNALFGMHKVRASKTPGKTKHFQTLFWTPQVRLVDCPGLVMPSFVPMETQVLAGILPISKVSAVPACLYYAAGLIPIEKVFGLVHPSLQAPVVEDKRTWRGDVQPETATVVKAAQWTAMDLLTAFADKKGWVTAKAGRSDVHRAGNAILRSLAEGKVAWAFWPPGTDTSTFTDEAGSGIWIPHVEIEESEDEEEDEGEDESEEEASENSSQEEAEDDSEEEEEPRPSGFGRFGAFSVIEIEEGEEEGEDDSWSLICDDRTSSS